MPQDYFEPGQWNAICDVCGFRFKSGQMKKRWDGLMVDDKCWEPRHPQDFLKVFPEEISVPWSRPEGTPIYTLVCYIWDSSAYAGLGSAGCMAAGYAPLTYDQLLAMKNGT